MAPSDQNSGRRNEPSLYEVLSITPQSLQGQDPQAAAKAVKQAYRRALLKHHPDKHPQQQQARPGDGGGAAAATKTTSSSASSTLAARTTAATGGSSSSDATYTVDQITHAYMVLGAAKQRSEYTRSLRAPTSSTSARSYEFQTGVETVDLDDLVLDERKGLYHRGCRCGQARGYCFREQDLDDVAEHGELMVECMGCSLWLRVLFEEVTDDEEDDAAAPSPPAKAPADAQARTTGWPAERTVSSGSREGKTGR